MVGKVIVVGFPPRPMLSLTLGSWLGFPYGHGLSLVSRL